MRRWIEPTSVQQSIKLPSRRLQQVNLLGLQRTIACKPILYILWHCSSSQMLHKLDFESDNKTSDTDQLATDKSMLVFITSFTVNKVQR
jgi:hypothetical protein